MKKRVLIGYLPKSLVKWGIIEDFSILDEVIYGLSKKEAQEEYGEEVRRVKITIEEVK